MAAVRAYLLSMLAVRRYGEKDFTRTFTHPWLIWEPGAWVPASPSAVSSDTHASGGRGYNPQATGDALCFELAERRPLKVGRSRSCDIQLNDATVSREHLILEPEPIGLGWFALPAKTTKTTELNGAPLAAQSLPLRAQDRLRLGDVTLSFADQDALLERLDQQLRKASVK
jgi:type III secretion system (T3SS) inner membrane Yop/YscD-like protein